jgi:RHH-type transcriptional regulator, proline utilization regulon repressor / proline dehydrogenase / delta 1-pyrroline-5-carboxylate dehydrogenase
MEPSAFDSAVQRCSALRLLCLQDEIADHILTMLKGAMAELATGNPDKLSVDVGPVITLSAQRSILDYVQKMRDRQCCVHQSQTLAETAEGIFVPPTLIEISQASELANEVFGPVLHVVRYKREGLDALIDGINAFGYGLTFGLHSRIEETVVHVTKRIDAGNIYVNRNMIGAAVGVQPFGGSGLSGTGPKAGGPFYLARLLAGQPARTAMTTQGEHSKASMYAQWLAEQGHSEAASRCRVYITRSPLGNSQDMAGPVGERNIYSLHPRGVVRCVAQTTFGLLVQIAAVLATGNRAVVDCPADALAVLKEIPDELKSAICVFYAAEVVEAILFEGDSDQLSILAQNDAERPGAIRPIHSVTIESGFRRLLLGLAGEGAHDQRQHGCRRGQREPYGHRLIMTDDRKVRIPRILLLGCGRMGVSLLSRWLSKRGRRGVGDGIRHHIE